MTKLFTRTDKKPVAFTLIELLISTAILSVLMSSAWFTFISIQRAATHSNERYSFLIEATVAITEISSIVSEASPNRQQGKDTHFDGKEHSLSLTSLHSSSRDTPQEFISIQKTNKGLTIESTPLAWLLRKKDLNSTSLRKTFPAIEEVSFEYGSGKNSQWLKEWNQAQKGKIPPYIKNIPYHENFKGHGNHL